MPGGDPVLLVVLACIAVIVLGPRQYVSLAGFGIMGAVAAVLLLGRGDIVIPVFALAGAGSVLLGVRALGKLAGVWDRFGPPPEAQYGVPPQNGADQHRHDRIWR